MAVAHSQQEYPARCSTPRIWTCPTENSDFSTVRVCCWLTFRPPDFFSCTGTVQPPPLGVPLFVPVLWIRLSGGELCFPLCPHCAQAATGSHHHPAAANRLKPCRHADRSWRNVYWTQELRAAKRAGYTCDIFWFGLLCGGPVLRAFQDTGDSQLLSVERRTMQQDAVLEIPLKSRHSKMCRQ